MNFKLCIINGCGRAATGRHCSSHTRQLREYGYTWFIGKDVINGRTSLQDRIPRWRSRSVTNQKDCWLWQGAIRSKGYATVTYKRKNYSLHKLVWEHINGDVPKELELDHLCRNRSCWNPKHLEPVTKIENCKRGDCGKHLKVRTHCPQGHEYSVENTKIKTHPRGNYRLCKKCEKDQYRKHYDERRRKNVKRNSNKGIVTTSHK